MSPRSPATWQVFQPIHLTIISYIGSLRRAVMGTPQVRGQPRKLRRVFPNSVQAHVAFRDNPSGRAAWKALRRVVNLNVHDLRGDESMKRTIWLAAALTAFAATGALAATEPSADDKAAIFKAAGFTKKGDKYVR